MAALWKLCGSLDLREAIVLANLLFSFVIFPCPTSTFLKHKPTGRVEGSLFRHFTSIPSLLDT